MKYVAGQKVRLHGPMLVQGPLGQISMDAEESVLGKVFVAYPDGTYTVKTDEPVVGINYFVRVRENRLSPAD